MTEARLWLIRHAPVDGPRDIIHDPDAPADVRDTAAIARVRAQLPSPHTAFCSPARRTRETASALGLTPVLEAAFREQSFGEWTGRRHDDLRRELGPAYDAFWRAPASVPFPTFASF